MKKLRKCRHCEQEFISKATKVCPECKKKFYDKAVQMGYIKPTKCPKCGSENTSKFSICHKCRKADLELAVKLELIKPRPKITRTKRVFYLRKKARKQKRNLLEKYGPICFFCGYAFTEQELTIDHFIEISRGGTSDQNNLRLACVKCHNKKTNLYQRYLNNDLPTL